MPADMDTTWEDMYLAAYRLSWPTTPEPPKPAIVLGRALKDAVGLCRRQRFNGWAVPLSAPAE